MALSKIFFCLLAISRLRLDFVRADPTHFGTALRLGLFECTTFTRVPWSLSPIKFKRYYQALLWHAFHHNSSKSHLIFLVWLNLRLHLMYLFFNLEFLFRGYLGSFLKHHGWVHLGLDFNLLPWGLPHLLGNSWKTKWEWRKTFSKLRNKTRKLSFTIFIEAKYPWIRCEMLQTCYLIIEIQIEVIHNWPKKVNH